MLTEEQSTVDEQGTRMSPRAVVVSAAVGLLLVVWFFVAWLGLSRNAVDAAGESVGSGFALLVLAAVVGAIRRGR